MYIAGADGGYGAREPHVDFALPNLVSSAMVGAPRALATMIARGDVAKKLDGIRAEGFGIRRLTIGRKAKRDGCRTNGVHLEIEGWPQGEAQLAILLDAVVEIATEARLERASRATRGVCGPHPEVVAYEQADEQARRTGVRLAAGVLATCMALAGFVIAATAIMAPV
ncbi:MAG: hypothetical protein JST00_31060 [Deltaproteobacteria bacterium]|nr:hypothetical protein [Deltaproteobacteria bacterium]